MLLFHRAWACDGEPAQTSSCYAYRTFREMTGMAAILGRHDDAQRYAAIAEKLKHDFNAAFYKGDGLYENGFACGQAMALEFGLVRESEVAATRRRCSGISRPGHMRTSPA